MKRICLVIICMFALVFSPVVTFGASVTISEITPDIDCSETGFAVADLYTNSDTTEDFTIVCEIDSNHHLGVKVTMHSANAGHMFNSNGDKYTPVNYGVLGASFQANDSDLNQTGTNAGYTITWAGVTAAANNLSNLYQPAGSAAEVFRIVPDATADSTLALGTATADNLTFNFESNFISTTTTTLQYAGADQLIAGDYEDTVTIIMTQLGGSNTTPISQALDIE